MNSFSEKCILNNGVQIPCIGYGTYLTSNEEVGKAVKDAVEIGYRHIDTATAYENEQGVGAGIRDCGVAREDLFITGKVWNTDRGYDKTLRAFDQTLKKLGLTYLDLYLIHYPEPARDGDDSWKKVNLETWRAMEQLVKEGKIRALGVSNFLPHHLEPLMQAAEIQPAVNQIEFHPGYYEHQKEVLEFCQKHGVLVEAWGPLGQGKLFQHSMLTEIAAHHNKSVSQVCIRWCMQLGVLPLPKSVSRERMLANTEVFDFTLSDEEMRRICGMEFIGSGLDPDHLPF